jgi:type VI secretion system secreted protein Hcp
MMNRQRNQARFGIGAVVLIVLLGLSLLVFAGNLQAGRVPAGVLAAATHPLPASSGPQIAIYLQYEGIPGEATDKEHAGWCNILSFSQEQTFSGTGAVATKGPAGRATLKDIVVTKTIDKTSPRIAQSLWQGSHLKRVRIDVTRSLPSGHKSCYAYELTDVMVTRCHVTGTAGAPGLPVEEIALDFRELKTTYTEYDSSGAPKGSVTATYSSK